MSCVVYNKKYFQESIEALYEFRDTFFDHHDIKQAGAKNDLVREQLKLVMEGVEKLQGKISR